MSFVSVFYLFVIVLSWLILLNILGHEPSFEKFRTYLKEVRIDRKEELLRYMQMPAYEQKKNKIPEYKFFSSVINFLIESRGEFGCEIVSSLRELRISIRKDSKESKRIKSSFYGGIAQYGVIFIFSWAFLVMAEILLEVSIDRKSLILPFCIQTFGILIYIGLFSYLKNKFFYIFENYFKALYTFRALLNVSLPIGSAISKSRIGELANDKDMLILKRRIFDFIERVKEHGHFSLDELDNVIEEAWDNFDLRIEKFDKVLGSLKLVIIMLFALPGFLSIIYFVMIKIQSLA